MGCLLHTDMQYLYMYKTTSVHTKVTDGALQGSIFGYVLFIHMNGIQSSIYYKN